MHTKIANILSEKQNRLSINNKKTKVLIVEKRQSKTIPTDFTFGSKPLEVCRSHSYLGCTIPNNGNFHLMEISNKLQSLFRKRNFS